MIDEKQVSEIVKNVLSGMDISSLEDKPKRKQLGVFDSMEDAIAACNKAYQTFRYYNKEQSNFLSAHFNPNGYFFCKYSL